MDLSKELINLFESGEGDIFDVPKKVLAMTSDDRLAESFHEITRFVETNDRLPDISAEDMSEASLASRLNGMRKNVEKVSKLKPFDSLGLLEVDEPPKSIDDLFENDDFGLFDSPTDILKLKHVPSYDKKAAPESVARRKAAADFDLFKPGFIEMQQGLESGKYKLIRFKNSDQISMGRYYISLGLMVFVEKIGKKKMVNGFPKARTRLIFENGTESEMYVRSLAIDLYEDGYLVVDNDYSDTTGTLQEGDEVKGYIYVLKSLSEDPKVSTIKDLYKIGFSTTTISVRIKGAENDPTYLMSSVEVVDSYVLTGNFNPQKVEHFIHRIFADAKVSLTIIDKNGDEYTPSEWYSVPLVAIEQAVNMLQNGDIIDFHYDKESRQLRPNETQDYDADLIMVG